jgi:hypothetical protein
VADALGGLSSAPAVVSAFCGLGGADVSEATWEAMLESGRRGLAGEAETAARFYHEGVAL